MVLLYEGTMQEFNYFNILTVKNKKMHLKLKYFQKHLKNNFNKKSVRTFHW